MNSGGDAYPNGGNGFRPYDFSHHNPAGAQCSGDPSRETEAVAGLAGLYYNTSTTNSNYAAMPQQQHEPDAGEEYHSEEINSAEEQEEEEDSDNDDGDDGEEHLLDNDDSGSKPSNKQQQQHLILWDTRYKQLVEHKRQFNTCMVSMLKDKILSQWVKKQRSLNKKGKLSQERYDRLALLDFDFEGKPRSGTGPPRGVTKDQHFDNRCQQLIKFKQRHGHCNVPLKSSSVKKKLKLPASDYALGSWLDQQNKLNLKGTLTQERHDRLVEIGQIFRTEEKGTKYDILWNKQYEAVIEYKEKHGNTNVPARWPENPSLATWVGTQRARHKINKVSDDRLRKLKEIEFDFVGGIGRIGHFWEQGFRELVDYKKKYGVGTIYVPLKFECSLRLFNWAKKEKSKYLENSSIQTKEQISSLKNLGFDFLPINDHKFGGMYKTLQKYKTENGNCDVPPDYEKDPALTRWVDVQREKYAREKISIKHHSLLEEIGFTWEVSQPDEGFKPGDEDNEQEKPTLLERPPDGSRQGEDIFIQKWETRCNELVEYKKKHGTLTVTKSHDKVLWLWVKKQREQYRHSKFTKDRYSKLIEIGFSFKGERRQTSQMIEKAKINAAQLWEKRLQQLIEFKQTHGHFVPKRYTSAEKKNLPPGDYGLGDWINTQNNKYMRGELEQEKYDKLIKIGWTPHTFNGTRKDVKRWEQMYNKLTAYKEQNGDCYVPNTYPADQELANWVTQQRTLHIAKRQDKERVEKLRALDFPFKPHDRENKRKAAWEKNYQKLQDYKAKNGSAKLPLKYKGDNSLGSWCQTQRQRHRAKQMSEEEEALLVLLGFDFTMEWRPMNERERRLWELRYSELVEYKKKHDNCRVPTNYPENKELGRWVVTQRKKLKDFTMRWECANALSAIGFIWSGQNGNKRSYKNEVNAPESLCGTVKNGHFVANGILDPEETEWQMFFNKLKDYKRKYGHWAICEAKHNPLAQWAKRQRNSKCNGNITKVHYDQLLDLGFFTPKPVIPKPKSDTGKEKDFLFQAALAAQKAALAQKSLENDTAKTTKNDC